MISNFEEMLDKLLTERPNAIKSRKARNWKTGKKSERIIIYYHGVIVYKRDW